MNATEITSTIDACDTWCEAAEMPTYSMLVRAFDLMISRQSSEEQAHIANLPNYRSILQVARFVSAHVRSEAFLAVIKTND